MQRKPIKYLFDAGLWYAFVRKHRCPKCSGRLVLAYDSRVICKNTLEAENYDFSIGAGDSSYFDEVEFRVGCFECKKCQKRFTFSEIKEREANQ